MVSGSGPMAMEMVILMAVHRGLGQVDNLDASELDDPIWATVNTHGRDPTAS